MQSLSSIAGIVRYINTEMRRGVRASINCEIAGNLSFRALDTNDMIIWNRNSNFKIILVYQNGNLVQFKSFLMYTVVLKQILMFD